MKKCLILAVDVGIGHHTQAYLLSKKFQKEGWKADYFDFDELIKTSPIKKTFLEKISAELLVFYTRTFLTKIFTSFANESIFAFLNYVSSRMPVLGFVPFSFLFEKNLAQYFDKTVNLNEYDLVITTHPNAARVSAYCAKIKNYNIPVFNCAFDPMSFETLIAIPIYNFEFIGYKNSYMVLKDQDTAEVFHKSTGMKYENIIVSQNLNFDEFQINQKNHKSYTFGVIQDNFKTSIEDKNCVEFIKQTKLKFSEEIRFILLVEDKTIKYLENFYSDHKMITVEKFEEDKYHDYDFIFVRKNSTQLVKYIENQISIINSVDLVLTRPSEVPSLASLFGVGSVVTNPFAPVEDYMRKIYIKEGFAINYSDFDSLDYEMIDNFKKAALKSKYRLNVNSVYDAISQKMI